MKYWLRRKFYSFTYFLIGLDCGPLIIGRRGKYLYIDPYGQIWRIIPTGDSSNPLIITLLEK